MIMEGDQVNGLCIICHKSLASVEETVVLRQKGADGFNSWAKKKGHSLRVVPGTRLHKICRKNYTRESSRSSSSVTEEQEPRVSTRSSSGIFDFKHHCFYCGKQITEREKQLKKIHWVSCKNKEVDKAVLNAIEQRTNDEWALEVKGRLEFVNDLCTEDALYHGLCDLRFRNGREKPFSSEQTPDTSRKRGRKVDEEREEVLLEIIEYLRQNDEDQITISELNEMMAAKIPAHSQAFTSKWLKARLLEQLKDEVIITNINNKTNVITFLEKASKILSDFKADKVERSEEEEKYHIVRTAAKIIKNDIKLLESKLENYPTAFNMESAENNLSYLPMSLQIILENLFVGKDNTVAIPSIGQAIMQQVRPRALIPPLQIGLAVQMHRHFGSRFLIDSLNKHGYCASYNEVLNYERCTAISQGTKIPGLNTSDTETNHFIQYTADNVDHNLRTLDGRGTFHGMGIIVSTTPRLNCRSVIPRLKDVSTVDLVKLTDIERKILPSKKKIQVKFQCLRDPIQSSIDSLSSMWAASWLLNPKQPLWSGYMQMVSSGSYPGQSSIRFMPMIDLKSTDPVCILSTMKFVTEQSLYYKMTPVLTFDQPLYWKAMSIKETLDYSDSIKKCVIRLGAFHQLMSFYGAIGYIMQGSGLE